MPFGAFDRVIAWVEITPQFYKRRGGSAVVYGGEAMRWIFAVLPTLVALAAIAAFWLMSNAAQREYRLYQASIDIRQVDVMGDLLTISKIHDARIRALEEKRDMRSAYIGD